MRPDSIGFFWQDLPPEKKAKVEKVKRTPPPRDWEKPDYLPGLKEALSFNVPMFDSDTLFMACLNREKLVFDIEIYPNYFLAAFASLETGRVIYFESTHMTQLDTQGLSFVLHNFLTIGFNSIPFDLPMAALAIAGKSVPELKHAANQIIFEQMRASDILKTAKVKKLQVDHVDLIEVAPLRASLKIYGGRLHAPKMQDLPFPPDIMLSPEQIAIVRFYCINDLSNTAFLSMALREQVSLRESMSQQYGIDLRSKSDAQIAEAVITHELEKISGHRVYRPKIDPGTFYKYNTPSFIRYETPMMNHMLQIVQGAYFVVADTGSICMPPELNELEIRIANSVYRMGIGGLHSSEESTYHKADEKKLLRDIDVESFYPKIILNQGLYPHHLGPAFLIVYEQIVSRRLAAKGRGDKVVSDSLKIVINGSYGKLGSKYSNLYSPDLLIQVTITGQLSLLMLIERLELRGISVVSANTDGIVVSCDRDKEGLLNDIIAWWERDTNFKMEATDYIAIYSRDVNSYVAIKKDGKTKTKGAFANPWADVKNPAGRLHKNPSCQICIEAVEAMLTKGVPIMTTLKSSKDVRKFVSVRTVKGGAVKLYDPIPIPEHSTPEELIRRAGFYEAEGGTWRHPAYEENLAHFSTEDAYKSAQTMLTVFARQEYLGKAVRWYYSNNCPGDMVYASSGNLVPKSAGARPLMELPNELPSDIDFAWYEAEAEGLLEDLGYYPK